MRGVEIVFLGRKKRKLSNPLATVFTIPFILTPMSAGVLLASDKALAAMGCVTFTVIFAITYKFGMWLTPKLRRSGIPEALKAN